MGFRVRHAVVFKPFERMREFTPAFGWPSTIVTLVLVVALSVGFGFQLSRRSLAIDVAPVGVWESQQAIDGAVTIVRRIAFTAPRAGRWLEVTRDSSGSVVTDSLRFQLEGPRATRFCINAPVVDCRILVASRDSLVMMFGTPTVERPAGDVLWVFRRPQ
jgi:hypothetical protein